MDKSKSQNYETRHFQSFIFSNYFILLQVAEDLEPILRTLGMRQEYTLVTAPVHHKAPCSHIHTLIQFTFQHGFGRLEETRQPRGNPHGHVENKRNSTQTVNLVKTGILEL